MGIVVIGSLNLDLVVRVPRFPDSGETLIGQDYKSHPGGKGLNQAVAISRCGCRVKMVGVLGDEGAVPSLPFRRSILALIKSQPND